MIRKKWEKKIMKKKGQWDKQQEFTDGWELERKKKKVKKKKRETFKLLHSGVTHEWGKETQVMGEKTEKISCLKKEDAKVGPIVDKAEKAMDKMWVAVRVEGIW